jgi:antitoxin YefM
MITVNYTDLRKNLKSYLDRVVDDCEPLIVHRSSNTSVVVVPLDEYNAAKETEYLTSSPEMVRRVKQAEDEINDGQGEIIGIDDLWN